MSIIQTQSKPVDQVVMTTSNDDADLDQFIVYDSNERNESNHEETDQESDHEETDQEFDEEYQQVAKIKASKRTPQQQDFIASKNEDHDVRDTAEFDPLESNMAPESNEQLGVAKRSRKFLKRKYPAMFADREDDPAFHFDPFDELGQTVADNVVEYEEVEDLSRKIKACKDLLIQTLKKVRKAKDPDTKEQEKDNVEVTKLVLKDLRKSLQEAKKKEIRKNLEVQANALKYQGTKRIKRDKKFFDEDFDKLYGKNHTLKHNVDYYDKLWSWLENEAIRKTLVHTFDGTLVKIERAFGERGVLRFNGYLESKLFRSDFLPFIRDSASYLCNIQKKFGAKNDRIFQIEELIFTWKREVAELDSVKRYIKLLSKNTAKKCSAEQKEAIKFYIKNIVYIIENYGKFI